MDELVEHEGVVLWGLMGNVYRLINDRLRHDISEATGLDGSEFEFLLRLARFPDARGMATRVGETMGYSSAGTTKLVARLERKGLIERTRDPEDGRAYLVGMTDAGTEALRLGLEAHVPRLEAEVLGHLTDAQRGVLHTLLTRLDPTLRD
ncbi:MarR family winged helix-turn-helix transcriptional regulator [Streptacidiphilus jiangxiensis]|uniref:DNA-binding transcriptional regulator, MarR family n=1 Tax=Streptacidiphilus jiangxiensis TaxID=235985 RepID=A0A1H7G7L6_STRJI|nr:MarR family transcriptional regulator [Streptacidiphilus jiangxiensis]SEK34139.1 DNA-binding transcriptional regulator, MarR family [Streptacidiphilus jiangxiensis]